MAAQVKKALGKTQVHCGLVQVEALNSWDSSQQIMAVTKSTLEQVCLDKAQQQFTQAKWSPLLQLPAKTGLGSLQIDLPAFLQILNSTFPYDKISNEYTKKLLHQLQKPAQFCKVPSQMEAYIRLGGSMHVKLLLHPSQVYILVTTWWEKINHLMATVPLLMGISLEWWWHTLNVKLEKVAGNCAVEKLHIIMLFKANCNNNNKWIG